jgi:hypothetical protein
VASAAPDRESPDVVVHVEVIQRIGEIEIFPIAAERVDGRPPTVPPTAQDQSVKVIFDLVRESRVPRGIADLHPVLTIAAHPDIHWIVAAEGIARISAETIPAEEDDVVVQDNRHVPGPGGPLGIGGDQFPVHTIAGAPDVVEIRGIARLLTEETLLAAQQVEIPVFHHHAGTGAPAPLQPRTWGPKIAPGPAPVTISSVPSPKVKPTICSTVW